MSRLQKLVPKVGSLKVNLGGWMWRQDEPLPRPEVLRKAKLWASDDLLWMRDILASAPLQVDVSETEDSVKLETNFGSTIHVLKRDCGLPRTVSKIPFCLCVIDTRGMSVEDTDVLLGVPGRARFRDVPTFLFGGVAETEVQKAAVFKACGGDWVGEQRSIDVFTSEPSTAYTSSRRRLLLLLPEGAGGRKVPPCVNLTTAPTMNVAWTATVGIFRHLWRTPKERAQEARVDWVFVVSEELDLPVMISQRIDTHPSVVFCSTSTVLSTADIASKLKEKLKDAQEVAPLPWGYIMHAAHHLMPLFEVPVSSSEEEEDDADRAGSPPHRQHKRRHKTREGSSEEHFFWDSPTPKASKKPKPHKETRQASEEAVSSTKKPQKSKAKPKAKEPASGGRRLSGTDLAKRIGGGLAKP